jgi:predicted RNA-binding Zn ribbon-like protein
MSDPVGTFDWSGGHPALDLVNTLDERPFDPPIERLATYRDLVGFVELAGLVERSTAAELMRLSGRRCSNVLEQVRELRERLHNVLQAFHFERPLPATELAAISGSVRAAHASRTLVAANSQGFACHTWSDLLAPEIPLHACAIAAERLLIGVDRQKVRKCGAADCDVYFIDTSKAKHRQWCSMKGCGNREKQRRRRQPMDRARGPT